VFWAVKVRGEDHVSALLEDVYYTLHIRHEKRKRLILCCIPLLHVFKDIFMIKTMNGQ
jgi:hypothetical protein